MQKFLSWHKFSHVLFTILSLFFSFFLTVKALCFRAVPLSCSSIRLLVLCLFVLSYIVTTIYREWLIKLMEYQLAHTDDLIRFWRSKAKVTAGCGGQMFWTPYLMSNTWAILMKLTGNNQSHLPMTWLDVEGQWVAGGRSGTVGGMSPRCFFWVLCKRSIPKPDQHKSYYTTTVVRHWYVIRTDEQQLHNISHRTDK